jgi:CRISPR-associated protein Cmr5
MSGNDKAPIHQTLDQERAKAAWHFVKETHADPEKYKTLVKRFPALINHNGLGQTIAFLTAKKKGGNAEGELLDQLSRWLMRSGMNEHATCYVPPYNDVDYSTKEELSACISDHDSRTYIRATREALAFLDYLRRFADGLGAKP